MHFDLPILHGTIGSVHSHPGGTPRPSDTDRIFFNKHGVFHLIIAEPYAAENMVGFDKMGKKMEFSIIK
jgi:proteasome lid subunit RPN8/RPN11